MKKNVLIVSYSYPPANDPAAQRPYAIAKYLNRDKFNITVLTCGNQDSSLGFDDSFNELLENVTLIKIDAFLGNKVSSMRDDSPLDKTPSFKSKMKLKAAKIAASIIIPDKAILWYPAVRKYIQTNFESFKSVDYIYTTSPFFTNHIIGGFLNKKVPNATWVVDIRDFHYVKNIEFNKGLKRYINKKLEYSTLKNADKIVFISNAMSEVYQGYYPDQVHKMCVVYNGFDLEDFKDITVAPVHNKKMSIVYTGSFYGGIRSPYPLFELLDEAINKGVVGLDEIEVLIAGNLDNDIQDQIKKYASGACLNFLGRKSRKEVVALLTQSTLLWLIVSERITHYTGVPLKMYEYMAARRPILNFAPDQSEPSFIIENNNLGWNIDIENKQPSEQLEMFTKIVKSFRSGQLAEPLSEEILSKYNREAQTELIEKILLE
ncbi:hypothetical protein [Patiriisocius sp. Uisw_047]|uniref:hypothetical protein n=1 Tax=Patiriisocius sp. Uisw_047 TaxID=3230969 RepID=UPI0039ECA57F